jgi:hypothetical protein
MKPLSALGRMRQLHTIKNIETNVTMRIEEQSDRLNGGVSSHVRNSVVKDRANIHPYLFAFSLYNR